MIYLIAILLYLFGLTYIAVLKSRRIKTQDDFAVAGRQLRPWIMVLTMLAVWIGTGSILGNAERAYLDGLGALILPVGGFAGMILLSIIAARARNIELSSVPEIIGSRFGPVARMLAVIALVMAYMVIVSYQFDAGGRVIEVISTGPDGEPAIPGLQATIIAAIFVIGYTMIAGLYSLVYMDIVTGTIIILSLVLAFPILFLEAGGIAGITQNFEQMGRPEHMQFWNTYSRPQLINYLLPPLLLVMGDANQYQRIFASRNAKGATSAVTTLIFVSFAIELLIIGTAWVAASMTPDAADGRHILIYAAAAHMPMILGIVFMVTVVAIIISTADSFLLVPATSFINDVYTTHINPNANQKRIVFMSRMLVLVFGIIGFLVSLGFKASTGFFEKAMLAYTIYGAAITPSLVAALFWNRATKAGAVASILTGTVITLLWGQFTKLGDRLPNLVLQLDAVLPAILFSLMALILVSLLTKPEKPAVSGLE